MKRSTIIDDVVHSIDRHARRRLRQRNIPLSHVWETAKDPDEYEDLDRNAFRCGKMYGDKKLWVVMNPALHEDFITVRTAYWDEEYSSDRRAKDKSKHVSNVERLDRHNDNFHANKDKAFMKARKRSRKRK